MKPTYLHPTQESGRRLFSQNRKGPVVMLNLLKFRETADYSGLENLAPANSISGREAFERYISRTRPFLEESGGKILFLGESNDFLIRPEDEAWDYVMLIQQNSLRGTGLLWQHFHPESRTVYVLVLLCFPPGVILN